MNTSFCNQISHKLFIWSMRSAITSCPGLMCTFHLNDSILTATDMGIPKVRKKICSNFMLKKILMPRKNRLAERQVSVIPTWHAFNWRGEIEARYLLLQIGKWHKVTKVTFSGHALTKNEIALWNIIACNFPKKELWNKTWSVQFHNSVNEKAFDTLGKSLLYYARYFNWKNYT